MNEYNIKESCKNVSNTIAIIHKKSGDIIIGAQLKIDNKNNIEINRIARNPDYILKNSEKIIFDEIVNLYKNENISTIYIFSDLRFENLITKAYGFRMGMEVEPYGERKINYWYVHKNNYRKRIFRRNFQKKFLKEMFTKKGIPFDENKTEEELAKELGYVRIYDAGYRKFVKHLQ